MLTVYSYTFWAVIGRSLLVSAVFFYVQCTEVNGSVQRMGVTWG